jgi:uncharacterized membrane protein
MANTFDSGEAISFGWEKMKKYFWFFVGLVLLTCIFEAIPSSIANSFKGKIVVLYVLFTIAAWVIQMIVKMGVIKIVLDIIDKGEANLGTLFSGLNNLGNFIFGSIIYGLIVFGGLILFIVPGIIWAIKYQFFSYLIVDKNLSPMEAIRKSGEMTAGNKGKLFGFGLLLALINLAGAICLLIGLFATIPTTMVAMAYVYRKLIGDMVTEQPEAMPENIPTNQPAN